MCFNFEDEEEEGNEVGERGGLLLSASMVTEEGSLGSDGSFELFEEEEEPFELLEEELFDSLELFETLEGEATTLEVEAALSSFDNLVRCLDDEEDEETTDAEEEDEERDEDEGETGEERTELAEEAGERVLV